MIYEYGMRQSIERYDDLKARLDADQDPSNAEWFYFYEAHEQLEAKMAEHKQTWLEFEVPRLAQEVGDQGQIRLGVIRGDAFDFMKRVVKRHPDTLETCWDMDDITLIGLSPHKKWSFCRAQEAPIKIHSWPPRSMDHVRSGGPTIVIPRTDISWSVLPFSLTREEVMQNTHFVFFKGLEEMEREFLHKDGYSRRNYMN